MPSRAKYPQHWLQKNLRVTLPYAPQMILQGVDSATMDFLELTEDVLRERGDWDRIFRKHRSGNDPDAAMVELFCEASMVAFSFGVAYGLHLRKDAFTRAVQR